MGYAGMHWSATAGMQACSRLLQDTLASGKPECPSGCMSTLSMCWAWCLQHVACSSLTLQQRSLDLESLEHTTSGRGDTGNARLMLDMAADDAAGLAHPGHACLTDT